MENEIERLEKEALQCIDNFWSPINGFNKEVKHINAPHIYQTRDNLIACYFPHLMQAISNYQMALEEAKRIIEYGK